MCKEYDHSLLYPSGHIKYSFNMHVAYNKPLSFQISHPKGKEVIFEKENPNDQYDSKWLMTIILGPVRSIDEVKEIGSSMKEDLLNVLSFTLGVKVGEVVVAGFNVSPRPGEGAIINLVIPPLQISVRGYTEAKPLQDEEICEIRDGISIITSRPQNRTLIKLFRYAVGADDPVVQFMILYLIIYDICSNQLAVDGFIMKIAPATTQVLSPYTGRAETIYTKLRNEITHRANVDPDKTRTEIINHTGKFKEIVRTAVKIDKQIRVGPR